MFHFLQYALHQWIVKWPNLSSDQRTIGVMLGIITFLVLVVFPLEIVTAFVVCMYKGYKGTL